MVHNYKRCIIAKTKNAIMDLVEFIRLRPSLNYISIEREARLSRNTIHRLVSGRSNVSEKVAAKLIPVLEHYGYDARKKDPRLPKPTQTDLMDAIEEAQKEAHEVA